MPVQQSTAAIMFDEVGNLINTYVSVEAAETQAALYATGQQGQKFLVVSAEAFVFVEETP